MCALHLVRLLEESMNYTEARQMIDQISAKGSELGLTSTRNLLSLLGNPQDDLKFIHVGGTNGKGSLLAYLESVLRLAGYHVGRYISPTLFSYRERIQVDGTYIGKEDFARLMTRVAEAMDEMKKQGMGLPTVFEVETAVSFLYFKEKNCDLVLLEVGMGGRLDATNIIKTPVLTALASISMDHMEYLGGTLSEIAWNKAGIFKQGVPAVSAHQEISAAEVIRREASQKCCKCTFVQPDQIRDVIYGLEEQQFTYKQFENIKIHLAGLHQIENGALALECIASLRESGYVISDEAVREGMNRTQWKGRFTIIHRDPMVIIDGAHNPDAAMRLRETVEKYFPSQKKYYIFGVFSDKEYDKIIDSTADLAEHIFAIETPDNPRALPAKKLAEAVSRVNPSVEAVSSIEEAVRKCFALAKPKDVILIFGSLSFLGTVEQTISEIK